MIGWRTVGCPLWARVYARMYLYRCVCCEYVNNMRVPVVHSTPDIGGLTVLDSMAVFLVVVVVSDSDNVCVVMLPIALEYNMLEQ